MPVTTANSLNFEDEVYQKSPVVVSFWAFDCSMSLKLQPVLEKLADEVKVVKVDINESPDIVQHFDVTSVPTTIFFTEDTPRLLWTGASNLENLQKLLKKATEKSDDDCDSSLDSFFNQLRYVRRCQVPIPKFPIPKSVSSNAPSYASVEEMVLKVIPFAIGLLAFAATLYLATTSDSPPNTAARQNYDKPNDMSDELWSRTVRQFEREGGMNERDAKNSARIVWEINK